MCPLHFWLAEPLGNIPSAQKTEARQVRAFFAAIGIGSLVPPSGGLQPESQIIVVCSEPDQGP
jgi:hypothetical protein